MVCDPINLSVLWRPWKEMSSWETQLELRMACFLQYFIIKILSILNDEWFSIGIQNTAKFKMQGNLYCGEGSHLGDREAVRQRDSICLHFTLTDWKQAGFPETWLWKHPRGSLRRLGPSNFPQKYIFALSALWMCRAVAFCKQEGSNSENWPCFPHPWAQCKHTLLQEPYYAHTSYLWFQLCFLSPSSSFSPTLPPRRNLCRPAEEDGWVQFQKNLLVKGTGLWKSSWVKAVSGSNGVTEARLLTECSFTADQLWLRAQSFQLKCLGQSFPHFPGPQSLQSVLGKPFPQQWYITLLPRHLFFLKP